MEDLICLLATVRTLNYPYARPLTPKITHNARELWPQTGREQLRNTGNKVSSVVYSTTNTDKHFEVNL